MPKNRLDLSGIMDPSTRCIVLLTSCITRASNDTGPLPDTRSSSPYDVVRTGNSCCESPSSEWRTFSRTMRFTRQICSWARRCCTCRKFQWRTVFLMVKTWNRKVERSAYIMVRSANSRSRPGTNGADWTYMMITSVVTAAMVSTFSRPFGCWYWS